MLSQIGVDNALQSQWHTLEHSVATLASKLMSLANQLHLASGEAAGLVGITHRSVVVEHEEADLLSAMTHEDVRSVGEHVLVEWAVCLCVLHDMQIAKIRLNQALSERSHDSWLDGIVLACIMLWVRDLGELPLFECVLERLISELGLRKSAQRFHIVVLQVDIRIVKLVELCISQLILDDVEVHAVETL